MAFVTINLLFAAREFDEFVNVLILDCRHLNERSGPLYPAIYGRSIPSQNQDILIITRAGWKSLVDLGLDFEGVVLLRGNCRSFLSDDLCLCRYVYHSTGYFVLVTMLKAPLFTHNQGRLYAVEISR